MAVTDKNLPVDIVIVEPTKIDGEHVEIGTVYKKVDPEFAFELSAAGKARLATTELIADLRARKKAEAEAAEKRANEQALSNGGLTASLSESIAAAIQAGIAAGLQAAAPASNQG